MKARATTDKVIKKHAERTKRSLTAIAKFERESDDIEADMAEVPDSIPALSDMPDDVVAEEDPPILRREYHLRCFENKDVSVKKQRTESVSPDSYISFK